jgi:hypothetical protein
LIDYVEKHMREFTWRGEHYLMVGVNRSYIGDTAERGHTPPLRGRGLGAVVDCEAQARRRVPGVNLIGRLHTA